MEHLNYGTIDYCRTAALVSDRGSIDWFCILEFDSQELKDTFSAIGE